MMRLLVLPLVLVASAAAAAEPVDCAAIVSAAPVEFTYHEADESSVLQIYRDIPGNTVVWLKTINGKFVAKGVFIDGILTTGETTSAYHGKFKSSEAKYTQDGMPKHFDRRSDLKYSTTSSIVYADGSTNVSTTTYDYKFKSAGKEAVGPCILDVVRGESDRVNQTTGKAAHSYSLYFPQLTAAIIGQTAEPVIDDIKSKFDPITPIP
jgi:hypothetical protein